MLVLLSTDSQYKHSLCFTERCDGGSVPQTPQPLRATSDDTDYYRISIQYNRTHMWSSKFNQSKCRDSLEQVLVRTLSFSVTKNIFLYNIIVRMKKIRV